MANNEVLNMLSRALSAVTIRQEVISNNISNVNTKNYKAKKVSFEDAFKKALNGTGGTLKITNSKHLGFGGSLNEVQPEIVDNNETAMRIDGNNVDIDLEMANLAANQLMYNALIQQTNSKISTMRYIINEGKR